MPEKGPPLSIGVVLSSLGLMPGGLETVAAHLAGGLVHRGHRVVVVRGEWFGSIPMAGLLPPSIPTISVPCIPSMLRLSRMLGRFRPGWPLKLQSYSFLYGCLASWAVRRRLAELDVTLTFLEVETVGISRWRERRGGPNVSYFPGCIDRNNLQRDRSILRIATSRTIAQQHEPLNDIRIDGVVPPGIDEEWFGPHRDIRLKARKLVYVGRLEPSKGIAELLDIVEALRREIPGLELRLVGDGPLRGWVGIQCAARGLTEAVRCLGSLPPAHVREELCDADALVFPSRYESFGIAVLEALAAGTPVVASDLPALREVAGDAALLVPPGDQPRWVAAVRALLADQVERQRRSEAGRAQARRYTWSRSVTDTESYLYRAVHETRTGRFPSHGRRAQD